MAIKENMDLYRCEKCKKLYTSEYGRDKYRKYTDYVALTKAFDEIRNKYHNKSLAFPYGFGCGLANGDWNIVENMINTYFADMDVTIYRLSARSDEV